MFPMNDQFADFFNRFQPANNQFTNAFKQLFPTDGQFPGIGKNLLPGNEQFLSAVRTGIETQIAFLNTLSTTTFESTRKIVDLNMSAAKTSVEESTIIAKQLLTSQDPREAMQLVAALPQPTATKAVAYGRHLADIASVAQAEFARATQEQVSENLRRFTALVEDAAKNAPAGAENAVAVVKSAIANASAGYEQLAKTATQVAETVQTNVATAVDQATQATEQVASATGRTRK